MTRPQNRTQSDCIPPPVLLFVLAGYRHLWLLVFRIGYRISGLMTHPHNKIDFVACPPPPPPPGIFLNQTAHTNAQTQAAQTNAPNPSVFSKV